MSNYVVSWWPAVDLMKFKRVRPARVQGTLLVVVLLFIWTTHFFCFFFVIHISFQISCFFLNHKQPCWFVSNFVHLFDETDVDLYFSVGRPRKSTIMCHTWAQQGIHRWQASLVSICGVTPNVVAVLIFPFTPFFDLPFGETFVIVEHRTGILAKDPVGNNHSSHFINCELVAPDQWCI